MFLEIQSPMERSTMRRLHAVIRSAVALAAAVAGLASVVGDTARAQVPTIDIRATCQAAGKVTMSLNSPGSGGDLDICMKSETDAQQLMTKNWSTFDPSDRAGCIQPKVYLPSYIEWLTCFEMNKVVREMRQKGQLSQEVLVTDRRGYYILPTLSRD
jgi:hypothetical protein